MYRSFEYPLNGIHCGTNYRVLRNWGEGTRGFCDSDQTKITWNRTDGQYKYEFVFHQAKIGDDEWKKVKDDYRVVGCSFHPEGIFKAK